LQHDQHAQRDELTRDQGHVLEAGEEAATFLGCHLAQVGSRGAVFATHRQTLQQTGEDQQDRGPHANGFVTWRQGDNQRAEAHQQHRGHQCGFTAFTVSVQAHQPAADRAHQKAYGEDRSRVEQLCGGVALGEKSLGEVQRECGVNVPVVPLDHIADGTTENRFDTAGGGLFFRGRRHGPGRQGAGVIH